MPAFPQANREAVHCSGTWRCSGHSEQPLPKVLSEEAQRQDLEPQEADRPVLAKEVALRHCPRAASLEAAQVACSAFLAGPALRQGERWLWGLPAEVLELRQGASDRKPEGPPVLAHPAFAEAADSAVSTGLWPKATLSEAR